MPPRDSSPRASGRSIAVINFDEPRRTRAKAAFTTRRVPGSAQRTIITGRLRPRSGDLVLARVDRIGQHARLELPTGRMAKLHVGDEIVVAYGDRYATDQFEARVPLTMGPAQLVAGGGVAAQMISRTSGIRRATDITPVGLVGDERGVPINVADFALAPAQKPPPRPPSVAVVGTSMNSGKTTTIRYLANGLSAGGHRPGTAKLTGTGSGNDFWVMHDAGAHHVLDFTDVGMASTFCMPIPLIEKKIVELTDHLAAAGSCALLLEIADGVYQQETAALLRSDVLQGLTDRVIFAAAEALGAAHGVEHLRRLGLNVVAVSGKLTGSQLLIREAQVATQLPVLGTEELRDPATAAELVGFASPVRSARAATERTEQGPTEGEALPLLAGVPVRGERVPWADAPQPGVDIHHFEGHERD